MIPKPAPDEYASYYGRYIDQLPEGDILEILQTQIRQTQALLEALDETQGNFRYAPGKWSLKEVIGHLSDVERVFAYRALSFARQDPAPLPGIEQDDYVAAGRFEIRRLPSMVEEFTSVRAASLTLFASFDGETCSRRGNASQCDFTVRSIPYIIAGHERHHMNVVRQRYLGKP
jgi:hypothetical protein